MTTYTDEQVLSAIEALGSYETMCGFAHVLASVHADRTRLQAELKSEQSRCGDLEQQCEAEVAVASSYFDQIAELQAEVEAHAARLVWASHAWGGQRHDYSSHVLRRGGDGDLSDVCTFIDSARAKKGDV